MFLHVTCVMFILSLTTTRTNNNLNSSCRVIGQVKFEIPTLCMCKMTNVLRSVMFCLFYIQEMITDLQPKRRRRRIRRRIRSWLHRPLTLSSEMIHRMMRMWRRSVYPWVLYLGAREQLVPKTWRRWAEGIRLEWISVFQVLY